jgi:hypothetical protein
MALHWSFGHLQPKLWAKEGPGVKLYDKNIVGKCSFIYALFSLTNLVMRLIINLLVDSQATHFHVDNR